MRLSYKAISPLLTIVCITLTLAISTSSISAADVSQKSFGAWLSLLRKEALGSGIQQKTLDSALEDLQPVSRVIELDNNQPEA